VTLAERKSKLIADHAKGYLSNAQFAREMALIEANPRYRRGARSKASAKAAALSRQNESTSDLERMPPSRERPRGRPSKS
jgi:hypothetical protein